MLKGGGLVGREGCLDHFKTALDEICAREGAAGGH